MKVETFTISEMIGGFAVVAGLEGEITTTSCKRRSIHYIRSITKVLDDLVLADLKKGKKPAFAIVGGDEWYRLGYELEKMGAKGPGFEVTLNLHHISLRCIRVKRECIELGYLK